MTGDRLRQMADAATPGPWQAVEDEGGALTVTNMTDGPNRFAALVVSEWWFGTMSEADANLIAALGPDAARLLADAMDALSDAHSYECWCSHTKGAVCRHCKRREILTRFAALGEPQP